MKKALMVLFLIITIAPVFPQQKNSTRVFVFDIREEIAPPLLRKVEKAFQAARQWEAACIIIEINTYGGQLDVAEKIRTRILESRVPVYAYINKNAASAGALISLACDSIYMHTGSSLGAASVVDENANLLPEKYQSYMRSLMRATAEAKHRNPLIAEAMVTGSDSIHGISKPGKVLSLTPQEALKVHYCQAELNSLEEVLMQAGLTPNTVQTYQKGTLDYILEILLHPLVSMLLILLIVGGIYFEFQTPGAVIPILCSCIAMFLFFAAHYLEGLASHWEILIFILGLILLALEIFLIPGFGITGVLGILGVVSGLVLAQLNNVEMDFSFVSGSTLTQAIFLVICSMLVAVILSFYLSNRIIRSKRFGNIALTHHQSSTAGYTSADPNYQKMLGAIGVAHTILRPSGKVMIGRDIYDATAATAFIEKGCEVIVIRYESAQLIVKQHYS